jgi:hypothetical protein
MKNLVRFVSLLVVCLFLLPFYQTKAEPKPQIASNTSILNFRRCTVTDQPVLRFKLVNINSGLIKVSLKPSATWIKLSVTDFVQEEMEIDVRLAVSGLTIGSYEEKIEITSDGDNLTIKILLEIVKKKTRVKLTLDNPVELIDDVPQIPLEAAPFIMGGKSYLPLRFVMEAFGAKVEWEQITNELNPLAFIRYIRIKSPSIDIEYSSVDQIVFVDHRPLINNFQFTIRGSRAFVPAEFFTQTLGTDVFFAPGPRTYMIEY